MLKIALSCLTSKAFKVILMLKGVSKGYCSTDDISSRFFRDLLLDILEGRDNIFVHVWIIFVSLNFIKTFIHIKIIGIMESY